MPTTTTAITGMRTVGVPVVDQDEALRFYVDRLGLQVRMDAPVEQLGGRWIEVAPSDSPVSIALVLAGDGLPSGVQTGIRLTTPDVAALHRDLLEGGVGVGDLLDWPGVPAMFTLRDPDGNGLVVTEDGGSS